MDVVDHKGSIEKTRITKSKAEDVGKILDGGKIRFPAGGVHNPSNRLPAGEDSSKITRHMQSCRSSVLDMRPAGFVLLA